jgi:hypothetical protein
LAVWSAETCETQRSPPVLGQALVNVPNVLARVDVAMGVNALRVLGSPVKENSVHLVRLCPVPPLRARVRRGGLRWCFHHEVGPPEENRRSELLNECHFGTMDGFESCAEAFVGSRGVAHTRGDVSRTESNVSGPLFSLPPPLVFRQSQTKFVETPVPPCENPTSSKFTVFNFLTPSSRRHPRVLMSFLLPG